MKNTLMMLIFILLASASWTNAATVFNLVINGESTCTAFAVEGAKGEKLLLTAGHCAEDLTKTDFVFAFDHASGARFPVQLVEHVNDWFITEDYAIFKYSTGRSPDGPLKTTAEVPNVGDEVSVVAGPLGLVPFLIKGYYAGRVMKADEPHSQVNGMYWIQLPSAPGASGAPVFDKAGRVWGILIGMNIQLPGMTLVVPIPASVCGRAK